MWLLVSYPDPPPLHFYILSVYKNGGEVGLGTRLCDDLLQEDISSCRVLSRNVFVCVCWGGDGRGTCALRWGKGGGGLGQSRQENVSVSQSEHIHSSVYTAGKSLLYAIILYCNLENKFHRNVWIHCETFWLVRTRWPWLLPSHSDLMNWLLRLKLINLVVHN